MAFAVNRADINGRFCHINGTFIKGRSKNRDLTHPTKIANSDFGKTTYLPTYLPTYISALKRKSTGFSGF
jgi:hypothetical protein